MRERGLFIGGRWQAAASGDTRTIPDPATSEIVARSAVAGPADIDAAVAAAREAFPAWAAAHPDERAVVLRRAAALVDERIDEIAEVLTREQGKPIPDARKEIAFGAEVIRYYVEEARRVGGSIRPSSRPDIKSVVGYAPVGVVGAIIPWNYPVDLYCWKLGPALAAGCTIVAKPPVETPLSVALVTQCFHDAGLPPGVLADLPGAAAPGRALAAHPDVRLVTATASTATGQAIMRTAADTLKRLSLELGGQTPFLVLDDADIAEAAPAATRRSYSNMGQICIAVNRMLVHDAVADDFVEAVRDQIGGLTIGPGRDPDVGYGPLLNDRVRDKTRAHVADAVDRGATLVVGGREPDGPPYTRGAFYLPTLLDHVPVDARVMNEETFGPVCAIHRCRTDEELVSLANAPPYGLAAYVYTRDLERGWAIAERLEAGGVGINVNDITELQAPFGGWRLSGFGRELGREGLFTYLHTRHIRMRVRPLALP